MQNTGHRPVKEFEVCGDSILIRAQDEAVLNKEAAAFLRYVLSDFADLTVSGNTVKITSKYVEKIKRVLERPALRYQEAGRSYYKDPNADSIIE